MSRLRDSNFPNLKHKAMNSNHIKYLTPEIINEGTPIWVNPVGGLGDILMLSTALKRAHDAHGRKFRLARRTRYTRFFIHHPAIEEIGNPPEDARIVVNDYWSREEYADPNTPSLHILYKIFGVPECTDSELYLPLDDMDSDEATRILLENIPFGERNVFIATSSESPRKMMHPFKWHIIVEKLLAQRCSVFQLGHSGDIPIVGAYSLLGVTTPMQVCRLLEKAQLVITPDNFVMHAAQLARVPAIALFGPTEASHYAYPRHIALQADKRQCPHSDNCLGPHVADNYPTPCPLNEKHCMNTIDEPKIVDIAMSILNK